MIVTYIEYFYPGIIVSESSVEIVPDKTVPKVLNPKAYAFTFYERTEVKTEDGELLTGKKKYSHGRCYY